MTEQLERLVGPAEALEIAHRGKQKTQAAVGTPVLITEAEVGFSTGGGAVTAGHDGLADPGESGCACRPPNLCGISGGRTPQVAAPSEAVVVPGRPPHGT
jgi:hypothetical protein